MAAFCKKKKYNYKLYHIYLGFSLGSNAPANASLNLSFGATGPGAATSSPFSLGTALNTKTTIPATGTQLTLGNTVNVTTSTAPG